MGMKIKSLTNKPEKKISERDKRDENIYTERKNFSLWHNKMEKKTCEFLRRHR